MKHIYQIYKQPYSKDLPKTLNKSDIEDIMNKMYSEDVRQRIPLKIDTVNSLTMLPVLHYINSISNEFFGNSAPSTSMLNQEFLIGMFVMIAFILL